KSDEELEKLKEYGFNTVLIINNDINYLKIYTIATKSFKPVLTLIPDESLFRRKVNGDKILLADRFNKRDRNADYIDLEDEVFTEDHLYYSNEGYKGFSDYSIIGNNFSESGFAPYAVAIHIVYFDKDNYLRIRHFVSTSNDDIRNPAKKFYEAVTKLCGCKSIFNNESYALKEFKKYYNDGEYPGLGTVKKLSLMHHLEIMSRYLDGVK
ncbi:sce7725 family protein, partial [Clostridium perfringens]